MFAIVKNGAPEYFAGQFAISAEGIQYPLASLTKTEKEAYGIYEVQHDLAVPATHVKAGQELLFENGAVVLRAIAKPVVVNDVMVKIERDRRLNEDFLFQGVAYQRDDRSLRRITGAATLAGFAVAAGSPVGNLLWHNPEDGVSEFGWIASDNSVTPMDAQTCFAFGQAAASVESDIVFAAKTLREMDPIPADFVDDQWWP